VYACCAPDLDRHATRQPSTRIDYLPVKMVQMTGGGDAAGFEEHLRDDVKLRVYDAAKTMADCSSTATRSAWTWPYIEAVAHA
jgi:hypothetical protein